MKDVTGLLADARARQNNHYLNGFIHAYCDNQECTAREISVRIKTYYADDPVSVRCPLCGVITIPDCFVRAVETLDEYNKRTEREARRSVNVQRHLKKNATLSVPASVLFDDSLPD